MTDEPSSLPQTQVTQDMLARMIDNLAPKSDVFSGKKFFTLILERRGPEGVVNFIKKASDALDKGNDLDLSYDFDEVEREAFNKSRLQITRRNFLRTTAWKVGGAITLLDALSGGGGKLVDVIKPSETPSAPPSVKPTNRISAAHDHIHTYGMPVAETMIGAALIYEGHENKLEMKLEQISDAVLQLAEKLQIDKDRPTGRSRA